MRTFLTRSDNEIFPFITDEVFTHIRRKSFWEVLYGEIEPSDNFIISLFN